MGMFDIYTMTEQYELYDMIDYKNAYIGWEQDEQNPCLEHQVVKEELNLMYNLYDYILCAEKLPNKIIIHYGYEFSESIEMPYDTAQEWFYIHGYNKCMQYILKESYACLEYAINGVEEFCKVVAHNKAEQNFLEGYGY